ncbi:hypothetical protein AAMO2058_000331900 [Amorphochlora amoebiformis]
MPSDVRQTPQPTASHLDTDFVSYKNKAGVKFEVFTLTGAAEAFRKSGGDIQKVLADQHVYLSVKKKKRHSTANLAREFQTDNMLEIAEIIVLKGKIKSKVYKPSPITERIMDFIFFLEAVYALRVLLEKDMFPTFLTMCLGIAALIGMTMSSTRSVGRFFSRLLLSKSPFNDPLSSPNALRQFESQVWQLIVHTSMAAIAYRAYKLGDAFLEHPARYMKGWEPISDNEIRYQLEIEQVYIVQLAVWFVTLISHRFIDVRSGDYHVMYTHHISTIALVLVSYAVGRYATFGLVVFMLHDVSDIPLDIMKMLNLLRIENRAGFYGAEIGYVTLMPIWIYCRLYLFPVWIIFYGVWGSMYMERAPDGEQYWCSALKGKAGEELKLAGREEFLESVFQEDCVCCGGLMCFIMLFTLLILHVWWTYLVTR